jgi:hypothetical protein
MQRRRRIIRACGIFACSAFALLLWSKLKLVSGIPKTAYATPEADPTPSSPAPKPASSPEPVEPGAQGVDASPR